jgi:hypothetical protein
MQHTTKFIAVLAAGLFTSSAAFAAGAVVNGFDTNTLSTPDRDEGYAAFDLGFTANFFGTNYTSGYVLTNGAVTFDEAITNYWAKPLANIGYPIIAPFYADADATFNGQVTYGSGTFEGRSAFGVNWIDVAPYTIPGTPAATAFDSFQLLVVDRSDTGAGNFDIVFNYDDINWDVGGNGGLSAFVGYSNHAGEVIELLGSGKSGTFLNGGAYALAENSLNSDVTGRYVFEIRTPVVPEPETYAMMLVGLGLVGAVARRRRGLTRH